MSDRFFAVAGEVELLPREEKRFDPEQPRDGSGKWTDGGAGWQASAADVLGALSRAVPESVLAAAMVDALAPGQPLPPGMARHEVTAMYRSAQAAIKADAAALAEYHALKPGEIPTAAHLDRMFSDHRDEIAANLAPIKEGQVIWQDTNPLPTDQAYVRGFEEGRGLDDTSHSSLQGEELNRQESEMLAHLRGGGGELAAVVGSDGKLVFASSGTADEIRFDDKDIARIQRATATDPNVVGTHCHPGTDFNGVRAGGGGFSPPDIGTACTMGLREMRVVGERWTYVFRGTNDKLSNADFRIIAPIGERAQHEYMDNIDRTRTNILEVEERGWHHIWSSVARANPDRYTYYRFPTVKP